MDRVVLIAAFPGSSPFVEWMRVLGDMVDLREVDVVLIIESLFKRTFKCFLIKIFFYMYLF